MFNYYYYFLLCVNIREFRNLCIEMILATDMSYHFSQLKNIKNTMSLNETIDKPKALSLILHCADISHPSKTWHLHEKWTYALVSEFFAQVNPLRFLNNTFFVHLQSIKLNNAIRVTKKKSWVFHFHLYVTVIIHLSHNRKLVRTFLEFFCLCWIFHLII